MNRISLTFVWVFLLLVVTVFAREIHSFQTNLKYKGFENNQTYYVSPDGNDDNNGSIKSPFKTIQKAADKMEAGDICYIRKGIYRGNVILKKDGVAGKSILFSNYKDEKVIVTENKVITGWEHYKGNIYKAYCPDSIFQVFCNHQESPIASYPNITNKINPDEWADAFSDSTGKIVFKGKQFPKGYWNGAYCRVLTGYRWVAAIGKVDDGQDSMVQIVNKAYPLSKYNTKYLGNGKACILNHFNALDTSNEWIWRNDTLYYYAPSNIDINSLTIETRSQEYGFVGDNRKYIQIKGIHFFAASVSFKNAESCELENGSVQYPNYFKFYGSGWENNKGVFVSGKNNTIKGVYVAHCWGDGISMEGSNNTIDNCLVEDCDWMLTESAPINVSGFQLNITNTTCSDAGRSIIVHRLSPRIRIINNHLYNAGLGTDDLGMTYCYHTNGNGAEIAYNWVHDNKAKGIQYFNATGIYLDNQDTGFIVHHNVVWNCDYGIQTNKDAVNHQIYNNTIFNCKSPMFAWGQKGTGIYGQRVYNNLTEKEIKEGNDFKNNVVESKEYLEDITNFKFMPKTNSKAIGEGIPIEGITNISQGKLPTAGAYQYGEKAWIPGSSTKAIVNVFD